MKSDVEIRLQKAIYDKVFPGCVAAIVKGTNKSIIPAGHFTYSKYSPEMKEDSIFDVASVTKAIPTSCLALKLIEEEKLGLEDKVINYIPELKNRFRDNVRIKHLLTHTICYESSVRLSSLKNLPPLALLTRIFGLDYVAEPGLKFNYANSNSILLGLVIERISGKSIDKYADEIFFHPMGMKNTSFHPQKWTQGKIVPTEVDEWRRRLIQGEVHDESAWVLNKMMNVGSAGLFTTAEDLSIFCSMLIGKGKLDKRLYLKPQSVELIYRNHLSHIGDRYGLGWDVFSRRYMGHRASRYTFGKTGFTGCSVVCDIPRKVTIILLSNFIHPHRKDNYSDLNKVRSNVADIVFAN